LGKIEFQDRHFNRSVLILTSLSGVQKVSNFYPNWLKLAKVDKHKISTFIDEKWGKIM